MSTDSRTASSNPLTPATLLADEPALKRAFDAEFESCLAAAKSQLGDAPTMAPRVVETAFVNLWSQRATVATPAQLKAALAEEIRHGSARALSRRHSAGRFAGGKATTGQHAAAASSAADVWARVEKGIRGPAADDQAHSAAATAGRHEAAKQMNKMSKRPSWVIPVTIGVVALVISVVGMLYVDRLGVDDAIQGAVNNAGIQPLASSVGQIGSVVLGDKSNMKMGPETKVYIPDHFPEKIRALRVDGTANFDVAPTEAKGLPFTVVAKKVHVTATGTSFAVSSYATDSGVVVLVKEGTVVVKVNSKTMSTVTANQAVMVDNGVIRPATDAERDERLGWVNGTMTVANKPLRLVQATLGRWGFDVKVPDASLLDRPASISVPFDSTGHPMIKENMGQVEKSANVKLGSEGTNWVLRDATPGAKPAAPAKAAPAKGGKKK